MSSTLRSLDRLQDVNCACSEDGLYERDRSIANCAIDFTPKTENVPDLLRGNIASLRSKLELFSHKSNCEGATYGNAESGIDKLSTVPLIERAM